MSKDNAVPPLRSKSFLGVATADRQWVITGYVIVFGSLLLLSATFPSGPNGPARTALAEDEASQQNQTGR